MSHKETERYNEQQEELRQDRALTNEIENILLEFAELWNEVTTSDLQGIATVKAREIIKLVKGE